MPEGHARSRLQGARYLTQLSFFFVKDLLTLLRTLDKLAR